MKVFRSQITEENDYYYETQAETSRMSDVDDVENKDVDIVWKLKQTVKKPLLCSICGLSGNFMCSQCKNKRYCSKEHQLLDWSYGGHKFDCHSEHSSAQSNSGKVDVVNIGNSKFTNYLFKEMEIISEVEEIEIKAKPDPIDDKLPVLVQKGNEIDEEAEEDSKVEVDRPFLDFQETIRHNPDQVIRYARNPDYDQNAEPLFVSDKSDFDVPNCQLCGSKREFELQIMPQMLNYLQRPGNNNNDLEYIDWGTLLIYTCPNNCELPPDQNYTPEVIIRQNFTSDGIGGRYYKASMGLYTEEGVIDDAFDQIQI
ncbi:Programmed cell death protein 2 [Zancudomyces culisetae]|uniref:Programmed cell death protein 2 n=1 Tax=Zancudomyces culisetae TaxID=1213189 RepID=A0A1R1PF02_ZANCU|nr:Programmed cell death protein 2 [Zancudomyces culisetae]|eukprot:OMH79541.1 Programmed cell death protein 2 [Zancudomyces culisetae]